MIQVHLSEWHCKTHIFASNEFISRTGAVLRAMGSIHNKQGRYEEGLDFHTRSLANLRATLGDKHYFTADCCYNLGVDLIRKNDKEQAV